MRILNVTPTFRPAIGGIESVVEGLSLELARHGVTADVAHVAQGQKFAVENVKGRKIWRIPMHGHYFAGIAPRIGRISREYDLLHVHDPQLLAISANVRVFCRQVPAVLSTHGGFRHTRRFTHIKALHERYLIRKVLRQYRLILASSTNDYDYFSKFSERVFLAENGIDFSRIATLTPKKRSFWKWLYWGRIVKHKRLDLVCDLVIRARALGYPVELTICGTEFDDALTDIKTKIATRTSNAIRIIPGANDVELSNLIADSGIYVTASEYEGFGLTVLEAMSAGLPVIARAIAPINEFVSNNTGLLLSFDGTSSDDAALRTFLSDLPNQFAGLSEAAREMASSFCWTLRIRSFLNAYKDVLG